ncbi:alpha/beta hydrolase [Ahniella affigens]|uniref:Alpha/beta hydrolase n=1 Tax=Ahniella affigens TaxID=2021234 RepID=A0A2P1PVE8_9GAMM|nr:alpha/beta hydrolase [Ahniella affigens]AVP98800.1 alpha/beta hydrolase [Ahniella affigens]
MKRILFLLLMVVIAVGGCRSVYFGALNAAADSERLAPESFEFDTEHQLALDVYRPATCQNAPVLVFFYGGTWQHGERRWYRFVGERFASLGIVTVVPDYRKAPTVAFPSYVEDAARALAFVRANALAWCGDPKRISISGHSAGAHIAALLATDARYLAPYGITPKQSIASFIGLAGPYDFLPIESKELRVAFPDESRDTDTQPIRFVDGDEPTMLLIHGMDDELVWPRNSINLYARLQTVGVASELVLIPDIGHTRLLNQLGDAKDPFGISRSMLALLQRAQSE